MDKYAWIRLTVFKCQGRSKSRLVCRCEVVGFAGEKGLWSVAEEGLLPRGASGGVGSSAFCVRGSFAAAVLEAVNGLAASRSTIRRGVLVDSPAKRAVGALGDHLSRYRFGLTHWFHGR